jgi:hypothetical protein
MTQTSAVFSIVTMIENLCKEASIDGRTRPGPEALHPPSKIIVILILKNLFAFSSERSFLRYLAGHHPGLFSRLPEHSWFNRKARKLLQEQREIHVLLLSKLRADRIEIRIVDTTPIPVVRIYRSKKCKSFKPKVEASCGYCASKKMYYYGQKLTLFVTPDGIPTDHLLTLANIHDVRVLKENLEKIAPILKRKKLVADKGYYDGELETTLLNRYEATLVVPEKKRHQKKNTLEEKSLLRKRSIIETVNNQLQDQMNIDETRAKTLRGLQARIQSSILSFTFGIYFNRSFGRPSLALKSILV